MAKGVVRGWGVRVWDGVGKRGGWELGVRVCGSGVIGWVKVRMRGWWCEVRDGVGERVL